MKTKLKYFDLLCSNKVNKEDNQKLGLEILSKNQKRAQKMKLTIWLYLLVPLSYIVFIILGINLKLENDTIIIFKIISGFYVVISIIGFVHTFLCLSWLGYYFIFGMVVTRKKSFVWIIYNTLEESINTIKKRGKINYQLIDLAQYENLDYSKKRFGLIYWIYTMLFIFIILCLIIVIFYAIFSISIS